MTRGALLVAAASVLLATGDEVCPTLLIDAEPYTVELARLKDFIDGVTARVRVDGDTEYLKPDGETYARVVLSKGGVAGGVITEGQGYGLLAAGAVAASLPLSHPQRNETVLMARELFEGWKVMASRTGQFEDRNTEFDQCQQYAAGGAKPRCGNASLGESYFCLPAWKFSDDLVQQLDYGSAVDGDEDGILGMIFLTLAAEREPEHPDWYLPLVQWTYNSCSALFHYETVTNACDASLSQCRLTRAQPNEDEPMRLPKLGSCFGGYTCANPSYLAPAHYRACRNYMLAYAETAGADAAEAEALAPQWDAVIEGSLRVLADAQCDNGLWTNWWVPSDAVFLETWQKDQMENMKEDFPDTWNKFGGPYCAYSVPPGLVPSRKAIEYGYEAARAAWRVSLDAIWNGGDPVVDANATDDGAAGGAGAKQSVTLARNIGAYMVTNYPLKGDAAQGFCKLDSDGSETNVTLVDRWWDETEFIGTGAVAIAAAMLAPSGSGVPDDQAQLDSMWTALDACAIDSRDDYYPGSWCLITTITLTGMLPRLGGAVRALGATANATTTYASASLGEVCSIPPFPPPGPPPPLVPPSSPPGAPPGAPPDPPPPLPPPSPPPRPKSHADQWLIIGPSAFGASLLIAFLLVCAARSSRETIHDRMLTSLESSSTLGPDEDDYDDDAGSLPSAKSAERKEEEGLMSWVLSLLAWRPARAASPLHKDPSMSTQVWGDPQPVCSADDSVEPNAIDASSADDGSAKSSAVDVSQIEAEMMSSGDDSSKQKAADGDASPGSGRSAGTDASALTMRV